MLWEEFETAKLSAKRCTSATGGWPGMLCASRSIPRSKHEGSSTFSRQQNTSTWYTQRLSHSCIVPVCPAFSRFSLCGTKKKINQNKYLSKKRAPHQPGELAAQSRPEPLIAWWQAVRKRCTKTTVAFAKLRRQMLLSHLMIRTLIAPEKWL